MGELAWIRLARLFLYVNHVEPMALEMLVDNAGVILHLDLLFTVIGNGIGRHVSNLPAIGRPAAG